MLTDLCVKEKLKLPISFSFRSLTIFFFFNNFNNPYLFIFHILSFLFLIILIFLFLFYNSISFCLKSTHNSPSICNFMIFKIACGICYWIFFSLTKLTRITFFLESIAFLSSPPLLPIFIQLHFLELENLF